MTPRDHALIVACTICIGFMASGVVWLRTIAGFGLGFLGLLVSIEAILDRIGGNR